MQRLKHLTMQIVASIIIASLVLTGCQPGPAQQTDAPTGPSETSQAGSSPDQPAVRATLDPGPAPVSAETSEDVTITFAGWEYDRTLYEPLMEEFHKENPLITVQFAALPENTDINQDYDLMLASGGDTSIIYSAAYVKSLYFRELQPLIEADPTFDAEDFWPGALDGCLDLEGRQIGVPLFLNLQGVYFDPAAFQSGGVPLPKPGWTWDDFRSAATALTKTEGDVTRYGFAENYSTLVSPLVEAALDKTGGELDVAALQPTVQWYLDLARAGTIFVQPQYSDEQDFDWNKLWQDWSDMFQSDQRPAMWTGGLGDTLPGQIMAAPSDADPLAGMAIKDFGFVPYPVSATARNDRTTPVWLQCASMSNGTQHPREAWAWLNFLSHHRILRSDAGAWDRLQLPARQSVADAVNYWDGLPADLKDTILFAVEHAWYGGAFPQEASVMYEAVNRAATSSTDFAAFLEQKSTELAASITPSPTPNTTPIVVATPRPTLSPDVTVVNYFFQPWGPDQQALNTLVEKYNQTHPDVAIKVTSNFNANPADDYLAQITGQFDCFAWYPPTWDIQSPENFLDLTSLASAEGGGFLQDFDPGMLKAFSLDGGLYALPAFSQNQVMAYNVDLLAKRGIKAPAFDWTFDDLTNLLDKVASTNPSDTSYGMVFNEWDDYLFNGRGVNWADLQSDPPVPYLTGSDFASALTWILDLKDSGALLVLTNDNYDTVQQAMQQGQVAFWTTQAGMPNGYWYFDTQPAYKIGILPMPALKDPDSLYYGSSEIGHYISRDSKNAAACWDWIKYLSTQPNVFPGIPARLSVTKSAEWEAAVGRENAAAYRAALAEVQRTPPDQNSSSVISWPLYTWKQRIVAAAIKGEDYQKLIPAMQRVSEDYLACMATVNYTTMKDEEIQTEINNCAKQADPDGDWQTSGGGGGGG